MIKSSLLSKYYLATPLFVLVEFVAGSDIRISIPWGGSYFLYLGICFAVGIIFLKNSVVTNIFALVESSVNLILLFKSIYLPVFLMAGSPEQASAVNFEKNDIIHFIMVGIVLLYAFYTNPLIKKKR